VGSTGKVHLRLEVKYEFNCANFHVVRGGWRKLRKEEVHGLYSSPDIICAMNQGG
jgi:hypothetical protein